MIGGILLLAIAVFGLSILFGRGKIENFYKFLIWLIFAPILMAIVFNHLLWFWAGLPLWMRILSVMLLPFFVSALLRVLLPKSVWLQKLQRAFFEASIYIVTFPFRFLFRAANFFFQKELRSEELNSNRSFVGNKPPIINRREETGNQLFDK